MGKKQKTLTKSSSCNYLYDKNGNIIISKAFKQSCFSSETELETKSPKFSAKNYKITRLIAIIFLIFGFGLLYETFVGNNYGILSAIILIIGITNLIYRSLSVFYRPKNTQKDFDFSPEIAPIYSIIIALYKESDVVNNLFNALEKIDWPKDKLDIIFACEQDDIKTIQAIENNIDNQSQYRLFILPIGRVKTKPRALQSVLPFTKGRYIAVYDAEDIPHPKQLSAAFAKFVESDDNLAVVQAPLVPVNNNESWIAGQFCLDYAIWFRVILPFIASFSHFIPLGGTSNHFKRDALIKAGGWDPYNLTEDADLGLRLARFGYKAAMISPPTLEEAPPNLSTWIKQRSRWIGGHIQTLGVHLQSPISLYNQLGFSGIFVVLFGLFCGPLFSAFRIPLIIATCAKIIITNFDVKYLSVALFFGIFEFIISAIAIKRDGRKALIIPFLSLIFYWICHSIAFYRAIYNIFTRPYYWEKTPHGIAARKNEFKLKNSLY